MSNIRFLYDNKLDGATLIESSQVASLPVENLQNSPRTLIWRTTSDWLQWVQIDFDAAETIKAVALINHNFYNVGCVIRLLGSSLPYISGHGYAATCKGLWDWMSNDGSSRVAPYLTLTPHGTVGTPTIGWNGDAGMFGFKCFFDKTDGQYWSHADNDALDVGTGDFTLMGWVKISNTTNDMEFMNKSQSAPSTILYRWYLCNPGGKPEVHLINASGNVSRCANSIITNNAWHHIAVAVDRTSNLARFYLDGSPDSDWQDISAIGADTLSNSGIFYLGSNDVPDIFYDGYMGTMMLIKSKLTDAQIATAATEPAIKETLTYDSEIIIKNFTGGNCRYWRLEFANNQNPANYINIGRLFLGDYYECPRQVGQGWSPQVADPSVTQWSYGGQKYTDKKTLFRRFSLPIAMLSEAERQIFEAVWKQVGANKDIFIAVDYDNYPNEWSLYGRMQPQISFAGMRGFDRFYDLVIDFEESC